MIECDFVHVIGTRPNIPKFVPVYRSLKQFNQIVIHTGQHYSDSLSKSILKDLDFKDDFVNLGLNSGSHTDKVSKIILNLSGVLSSYNFKALVVYGDVDSTLAAALTGFLSTFPVIHIESGLRSKDLTMPEERNRILIDRCSSDLFTSTEEAMENLRREGFDSTSLHFVGNTMIDSVSYVQKNINPNQILNSLGIEYSNFVYVTLHRPSNVDNKARFKEILRKLSSLAINIPIVVAAHPRSIKDLMTISSNSVMVLPAVTYKESISLQMSSRFVVTDSGGIQEETSFLNKKCFTLRPNTERFITVSHGTNELIGLENLNFEHLENKIIANREIPYWDGLASERIAKILARIYN